MDITKTIRRAYVAGCKDRSLNPAEYDENADNYFIFLAHQEGASQREMYPHSYGNVPKILAEQAYWGARERREETNFLLR